MKNREAVFHTIIYRTAFSTEMSEKSSVKDIDKNRVASLVLQVKAQFEQRLSEMESRCGARMAATVLAGWENQFHHMVKTFDKIYDGYTIDREAEVVALNLYYRYWCSTEVGYHDVGEDTLMSLIK